MTEIKAADVKSLRDKTGLGIMECKAALKKQEEILTRRWNI